MRTTWQTPSIRCTSLVALYSAAAVTSVAVAVTVATTAAASDTASQKSKMIKFPLLYNGVKRANPGLLEPVQPCLEPRTPGRQCVSKVRSGRTLPLLSGQPSMRYHGPAGKRAYFLNTRDTFLQIIQNIRQNMTEHIHTLMHTYSTHIFVLLFCIICNVYI